MYGGLGGTTSVTEAVVGGGRIFRSCILAATGCSFSPCRGHVVCELVRLTRGRVRKVGLGSGLQGVTPAGFNERVAVPMSSVLGSRRSGRCAVTGTTFEDLSRGRVRCRSSRM